MILWIIHESLFEGCCVNTCVWKEPGNPSETTQLCYICGLEAEGWGFKKTRKQLLVSTGSSCGGPVCSSTAPPSGDNKAQHSHGGFYSFISNIQAAFTPTSKVWENFHWLTLWQLTHNSQQHIHSLQWKVTEKHTACKYSIWKIYLGFNVQWFKSRVIKMTHLGLTNLSQWSVCKAVGGTIRRLTVSVMNLYSSERRVNPQLPQVIITVCTRWHEGPLVSPHMGLRCVCALSENHTGLQSYKQYEIFITVHSDVFLAHDCKYSNSQFRNIETEKKNTWSESRFVDACAQKFAKGNDHCDCQQLSDILSPHNLRRRRPVSQTEGTRFVDHYVSGEVKTMCFLSEIRDIFKAANCFRNKSLTLVLHLTFFPQFTSQCI